MGMPSTKCEAIPPVSARPGEAPFPDEAPSLVMANALSRFTSFIGEVREELKQVSWPTREELLGSVLVVFVGVVLMASFISVCDFVLSKAAQLLLR